MSFKLIGITAHIKPDFAEASLFNYVIEPGDVNALQQAGGVPVALPPIFNEAEGERLLSKLDGLYLPGGGDVDGRFYGERGNPLLREISLQTDETELALTKAALRLGKPILAVCRGVQVLNVAAGGTLYADLIAQAPGALAHSPCEGQSPEFASHKVSLTPGSRVADILGEEQVWVNSFHHQAPRQIGQGLVVSALAPDGVVEALECPEHPFCIGVQWHPEIKHGNQAGMERLYQAFINTCQEGCSL